MKINVFNLVRTALHQDTKIWSFTNFEQAREKMFEEVEREIKIDKDRLARKDEHFAFNGYDVWKGNDYITISDGNKVEYEIIQTTMDSHQIQVEAIVDNVMLLAPACEKYRELIKNELLCYPENALPLYNNDIKHFVDTELDERLAKSAAAKIVSGYDEEFQDKYFQVTADYLEGNRGISLMLAVINGEENAIEDVKKEINKELGEDIFKTDYVWVAVKIWQDGSHFDFAENTSLYRSHASAAAAMDKAYEEAIEAFKGQYVGENVTYWCDDDVYQVSFDVDGYYDMWEGKIMKIYVQD